jgi:hypothetical protein
MAKEAITERLKFLTELIRLFFIALLAIGGSSFGLLLGAYDPVRWSFAGAGIVAVLGLGIVIMEVDKKSAGPPYSVMRSGNYDLRRHCSSWYSDNPWNDSLGSVVSKSVVGC